MLALGNDRLWLYLEHLSYREILSQLHDPTITVNGVSLLDGAQDGLHNFGVSIGLLLVSVEFDIWLRPLGFSLKRNGGDQP